MMTRSWLSRLGLLFMIPSLGWSASFDGAALSLWWGIPFAGILLSIALCPIFLPHFWHVHFGKIALFWGSIFLAAFTFAFGGKESLDLIIHALFTEYIPFIVLIFALYTVSGGILIWGNLRGSPKLNTSILALGTALASIMGTTGAAMLLIRPIIKANDNRRHNVHVIVFFIFLVANIGGGLTPLGDPPLFLGFLKGVDFGWTMIHMAKPVLLASVLLLVVFYFLDAYYFRQEDEVLHHKKDITPHSPIKIYGAWNGLLLLAIIACVLMSGLWKPNSFIDIFGTHVELQNIVRDILLALIALLSLKLTPKPIRAGNEFNWDPILEVAKLFACIFLTIAPVIAILKAGHQGALSGLVSMVNHGDGQPINTMYFWMTGILSSFLDNAPTYLVFFNLASGDPKILMTTLEQTLLAISMASVFMGANTYVGNAPNFMVKAIAQQRGIKMPSFFGYMLWSCAVLMPLFALCTWIFF